MKKIFLFLLVSTIASCSLAQTNYLYNNLWVLGGLGANVSMKFTNTSCNVIPNGISGLSMRGANVSMCDKNGNLAFVSNGSFIWNRYRQHMKNSERIGTGNWSNNFINAGDGLPFWGQAVSIPVLTDTNKYILFISNLEFEDSITSNAITDTLSYLTINMSAANDSGAVISKNNILLHDTIEPGRLLVIKHANGKDYWLLTRKLHSTLFYRFLIDSNGIVNGPYTQQIGSVFIDSTINHYQACVSTNGEMIAYNYGNYQGIYHGKVDIFNFDRCTGLLYNPRKLERTGNQDTVFFIGVSFSPNSKFLYLNGGGKLYQLDLDSTDLLKSSILVGKWDSTFSPFATTFYYQQLAPDGKIYVSCQGGNEYIHCITNPDVKGMGCNFVQKYKWFGTNTWFDGGMPNQPNYNLSALPIICNTGENEIKPIQKTNIVLFPNPVTNQLTIISNRYMVNTIEVYDMMGRVCSIPPFQRGLGGLELSTENLPLGMYYIKITTENGIIENRKFVKQ